MNLSSLIPSRDADTLNTSLRKPALTGAIGLAVLIGVLGVWSATTMIGGAIIASGHAVVEGNMKRIQSLDGGIVASIEVQNGDRVEAGDVLLRLDATLMQTNLDIARARLAAAMTLQARLVAEQSGADEITFPLPDPALGLPDASARQAGQRQIFAARAAVLDGGRERLVETQAQYEAQARGITGQMEAVREQLRLLEIDIGNMQTLADQGLARQSQMSELARARAELTGQLAGLEAEQSRLITAARDAELRTLQEERAFMESVVVELRTVTAEIQELMLEITTRQAQLARVDITAPVSGIVHEMQVSTLGGVVAPGETILEVVPVGEDLSFEVRVDPRAIDQVRPGQPAQLMLSSFDPQETPRLVATVADVSASAITDPATGQSYYRATLEVTPSEIARLGQVELMPGMPVEAFLQTHDRSVIAYLTEPLTSSLRHAFRE